MRYQVRILDVASAAVRVEAVEAASAQDVATPFERPGCVVLSVELEAQARAPRRTPLDVAWWCRELRTLLSAGMTVVEAIETLNAQALGKARAEVHSVLMAQLR